jgi:hypothetical protein
MPASGRRAGVVRDWPEAERVLKAPDWLRLVGSRGSAAQAAAGRAEAHYPERALWTALTELTTDAGELVHGKAATAAARMGGAARRRSMSRPGAAAQAVYQLAWRGSPETPPRRSKASFRLFAAGRWPLGVVGSTLVLF